MEASIKSLNGVSGIALGIFPYMYAVWADWLQ